jgi:hypothetical protein
MRHALLFLLFCKIWAHGAEIKIRGAAYFVIHTLQKSVMYRARSETIFCAPDFYRIRIPYTKIMSACQPLLKDTDAIITFHDPETDTLELKRDKNALATLATWHAMLDPKVKVYVYTAQMDPKYKTLQLYDRRGHLIIGLEHVSCRDDSSLEQYKEIIRDFADPSLLNTVRSEWNGERIGRRDKVILSYKKTYDVPLCSNSSTTLYFSGTDDPDEDYVVL